MTKVLGHRADEGIRATMERIFASYGRMGF